MVCFVAMVNHSLWGCSTMAKHINPHGALLRKGRISIPGQIYHLTTVTDKRRPLFADWELGRVVVKALHEQTERAETLAFVVMPDHLHWLVVLKAGDLSSLMREIKGKSAARINAYLQSGGVIWQRGFHDHALRAEEDVENMARYIAANPLRAGLVSRVGDYPLWDAVWL